MGKATQGYLTPESRQKIYIILASVSLILLFYSIWQIKPVVVEVDDQLGLASHFTLCYWIGLALLILDSILTFLDRELKKDAIFILILIVLGLFLLGIRVFAYENAGDPTVYYPYSVVNTLLAEHRLDISNPPTLQAYYSWPAIHFISASIEEIAGIGFGFVKYMPLFGILCFVFITYSIGKRLNLAPNRCFLISFLALSSWLFPFAGYYYPRLPAIILLLLVFMLVLTPRRTVAETIATMLIFSTLILSHGLTSLAAILGLILLSIYRKDARFAVLFLVIYGAWYMYQASWAFETGINAFTAPMADIRQLAQVERYQAPASMARLAARYSQLTYLASYFILVSGSAILFLWRRVIGERRKQVLALFCWSIGVALLIFWGHGETAFRAYDFLIVPAACVIVLSFWGRKLITALAITLMCLFPLLSPLANYGVDAVWGQVLTSELRGTGFFALKVKPQPPGDDYYYAYAAQLVAYNDPDLFVVGHVDPQWFGAGSPEEFDPAMMHKLRYIIVSKQGTDRVTFSWGEDPYATWPQTEVGEEADLVYNNGYFQIYANNLYIQYRLAQ